MRAVLLISVCFLMSACGASPTAPDISFRLIGHGGIPTDLRPGEPSGVVIRDSGAWSDFVRRSGLRAPSFNPEDPIPSVDFSSEMALALLLGQRPTTGYQIRIARMTQRGSDTLVVAAVEIVPCVGATAVNLVLLVFQIAQVRPTEAQGVAPVLRGRALEIVDAQGRVRASITVNPPTTVDSQAYPESVLFRLTDPKNGPVVKIDASEEGSGFGLSDDSPQGGIRLMAKNRTGTFLQVTNKNGREQQIRP